MSTSNCDKPMGTRKPIGRFTARPVSLAVVCVVAVCAFVVGAPTEVVPTQLPALLLPMSQVQACEDRTELLEGAQAPSGPEVDSLQALLQSSGRASAAGPEDQHVVERRRGRLRAAASALRTSSGAGSLDLLRAQAVREGLGVLLSSTSHQGIEGVLGNYPDVLRHYGVLDEGGRLRAPLWTLRAFLSARWNMLLELAPKAGLCAVEALAFEGWIALRAPRVALGRRLAAARAFESAGGWRGREALAVWLVQAGQGQEAYDLSRTLWREGDVLAAPRLRNHLLYLARHTAP